MRIREVKHDIARAKTILRELELNKKTESIKVTK
jgi:ribosomal protein L29